MIDRWLRCASIIGCTALMLALSTGSADAQQGAQTIRGTIVTEEGAPIPLRPMKRWDNGRDVLVAGDAAGVVAPASGEGI